MTRIAGAVLLALALAQSGIAQEVKSGSEAFTPNVGQPGKDVIWVPTPGALITRMLTMAKVTPGDHVVDLGSGDGRIAIAAGKEFGATALGVEYNADMVALSQRGAREAGVADKVQFVKGDIFATDFGKATVITMYLLPQLNLRLRPTILSMRPGTRVASHAFTMGEWEPDEQATVENRTAYLWIVPAKVDGRWAFRQTSGEGGFEVELGQTFQKVSGQVVLPGGARAPASGALRGDALTLTFRDDKNVERSLTGRVQGNQITASLPSGGGGGAQWVGVRK